MHFEVKAAQEKDAQVKENPFAAFLAARKTLPRPKSSSAPAWPSQERQDADPVLLALGKASREAAAYSLGLPASPAGDHFSTFLSLDPPGSRNSSRPLPEAEQLLRDEVLRAKRQLLEVTLQTELRALDPDSRQEDVVQSLEKLRRAHEYLSNPDSGLESLDAGRASSASASRGKRFGNMDTSAMLADTTLPVSPIQPAWSPSSRMSASASMPNLEASSRFLPNIGGNASRPFLKGEPLSPTLRKEEPNLSGFWSRTRCWNIGISKRDMKARRQTLGLPGGTVVLGNGRMPNFNDSRLLARGYFFAFQIDEIDNDHFPLDRLKDMSLVIGVSKHPARHRSCERPMYAYEVPDVVLLGYGGHLIDKGKWVKTSWDPKGLKSEDIIGLLVTEEGDLVVYVNEVQVLRVKTSLNDELNRSQEAVATPAPTTGGMLGLPQSPEASASRTGSKRRPSKFASAPAKRVLFPILDLHGRVSAVSLLPRMAPPNVPLECRNRLPG